MKTTRIMIAASLALASLVVPATAATANPVDCNATAIWTQDASGVVKNWSASGVLLGTVNGIANSSDIAITSDLSQIVTFSGDKLSFWNASTGAQVGSDATVTGAIANEGSIFPKGLGVISSNEILVDGDGKIFSVNLTSPFLSTIYADLSLLDYSAYPELGNSPSVDIAGDLLRLPNGDILAVTTNSTDLDVSGFLVRISGNADPRTMTIVGSFVLSSPAVAVYGAARAGDDIYLATGDGELLRLDSVPTASSLAQVEYTIVATDPGRSFYGAAGSNDSTDGPTGCTLVTARPVVAPAAAAPAAAAPAAAAPAAAAPAAAAPALARTGSEFWSTAGLLLPALALIGFGAARIASRRTKKA